MHDKDTPILQRLKCLALDFACGLDRHDGRVCGLAVELCSDSNAHISGDSNLIDERTREPTDVQRTPAERARYNTQAQEPSPSPTPVTSQELVLVLKKKPMCVPSRTRRKKMGRGRERNEEEKKKKFFSSSREQRFETPDVQTGKRFNFPSYARHRTRTASADGASHVDSAAR